MNEGANSENGHKQEQEGEYRLDDGYQGENRQFDSYGPCNGRPGYYRRNYNGDSANGNRLEQGRDHGLGGGKGCKGRGSNQERTYWRKSHDAKANQQLGNDKQEMNSEMNHEKVLDGQSNEEMRQTRTNGSLNGHEGKQDAGDEVIRSSETKEVNANDNGVNSDGSPSSQENVCNESEY